MTFKNLWGHLRTVQTHRKWVRHYCRLAGIPWQGWRHDLSKYSPVEFFESARYWNGTASPINGAKAANDDHISFAWQHHKGRNKHHWEYWTDEYSKGTICHIMPEKYFIEMVCDFLGAGRAYMGANDFSYAKEHEWWKRAREATHKGMLDLHKQMVDFILEKLRYCENFTESDAAVTTPEEAIKKGLIRKTYRIYKILNEHTNEDGETDGTATK